MKSFNKIFVFLVYLIPFTSFYLVLKPVFYFSEVFIQFDLLFQHQTKLLAPKFLRIIWFFKKFRFLKDLFCLFSCLNTWFGKGDYLFELASIQFVYFVLILFKILDLIAIWLRLVFFDVNKVEAGLFRWSFFPDSGDSVTNLLSFVLCVCRSTRDFGAVLVFDILKFLNFVSFQWGRTKLLMSCW